MTDGTTITVLARRIANALPATLHEPDPHLLDAFGVRYTGPASHLVLAALTRPDLVPHLPGGEHADGTDDALEQVRDAARLLGGWFTSPDLPRQDGWMFRDLDTLNACHAVATATVAARTFRLHDVGTRTLPLHTRHLLQVVAEATYHLPHRAWPWTADVNTPDPALPDTPPALDLAATGPDGAATVPVRFQVGYSVQQHYDFTADAAVPVTDVHRVMTASGSELVQYAYDKPVLLPAFRAAEPDEGDGMFTTLNVAGPGDADALAALTAPPARLRLHRVGADGPAYLDPILAEHLAWQAEQNVVSVTVPIPDPTAPAVAGTALTVYYVGRDHEHALRDGLRFLDPADAESAVLEGERVFTATFTMTDLRPH